MIGRSLRVSCSGKSAAIARHRVVALDLLAELVRQARLLGGDGARVQRPDAAGDGGDDEHERRRHQRLVLARRA